MQQPSETLTERFGRILVAERRRKGLTQQELADRLFLSSAETISRYERGEREPRLSTIVAIASVLGISPRALIPRAVESGTASETWWSEIEEILVRERAFTDAQLALTQDSIQSVAERLGVGKFKSEDEEA